jgi:putative PIN family toxin of toxin-antitoxin system
MTPRVVFDCMVFLQAGARDSGPAAACLRLVEQGQVELCLSREVLEEVRDVLSRPKLRQKFSALTDDRVAAFLEALTRKGHLFQDVPPAVPLERDPKDAKYLDLAVAAGAQFIVSRDKDILDLRADDNPAGRAFRERLPDVRILDPVELLRATSPTEQAP